MIDFGLSAVWEFAKSILGDYAKDRLKQKDSPTKARELIFNVYRSLDAVSEQTRRFVELMKEAEAEFGRHKSRQPEYIISEPLTKVMASLLETIVGLARALDTVNPQLDVQKHELVETIEFFMLSREGIIRKLEWLQKDKRVNREEFGKLVKTAEENANKITAAIGDLRSFIASQFAFKDSF